MKIPKWLIFIGKALQLFSTYLTTRFVARLFSTPIRYKAPEREQMFRKSAKNIRFKVPALNKELQIYEYGYSKKKVLLIHGWAGRGSQMYHLADKILENKMMVISFDGPAHGLSEGKQTNLLEFIESVKAIDNEFGPFDAAVGHSFGGMSLLNAVYNGCQFKKIVTIGADNSIPDIFDYFVSKMELSPRISASLKSLFESKYQRKISELNSDHCAKGVSIPTLVIHDSEDRYVNVSSAFAIRQNLENGEILITNGLGHHRILKDPGIVERVVAYFQ